MNNTQTVFVGLSGGVDSSVAALRLKKAGYKVVGVFIKVWHPDFMVCNWEAERLDAMRVAAHLDIPFLTCDAVDTYKEAVAKYFIDEYLAGRTPNPDVLCNQEVKFGAFLDFALSYDADFVATGHYVQKITGALHRGIDSNKDQSYFLWSLTQDQLDRALFPVGNSTKDTIRKEAALAKIPTATKKDSQGICFLGHVDIPEFLSHYTKLTPGNVLDISGQVIGTHQSALVYTLGQRHGFSVFNKTTESKQYYVVSKNINANTITVDSMPPLTNPKSNIKLNKTVLRRPVKPGQELEAQFRYRQHPFTTIVEDITSDSLTLRLASSVELPASGQSCVLYDKSYCIGGGIIE